MSAPSIYDMRDIIARVYKSETWKKRVEHMSERQVLGIYFSFLEQGKLNKKPIKPVMGYIPTKRAEVTVESNQDNSCEQLAFDI